jgi:hypothetical protein
VEAAVARDEARAETMAQAAELAEQQSQLADRRTRVDVLAARLAGLAQGTHAGVGVHFQWP